MKLPDRKYAVKRRENWVPIIGYEGLYEVSDTGRVRSLDRVDPLGRKRKGEMKALMRGGQGRLNVGLSKNGRVRFFPVHRLVLRHFVGPCPEGLWGLHIDDDHENNTVENLKWGTPKENSADRDRNGKNWQLNKTHCPRGHLLELPNLARNMWKKGYRSCLACSRAKGLISARKNEKFDLQTLSDSYYRDIMESGEDVEITRQEVRS